MGATKLLTAAGGGITLDAASTATDKTITIPARTGNMAVDGPAFSAWANGAQALTSATFTKVTFGSEYFDTNSNFASSTFQPTVAGYYQLNATLSIVGNSSTRQILSFYKNGTVWLRGADTAITTTTAVNISASTIMYLNGSTDFVEIYAYATGTSLQVANSVQAESSTFSGALVRAA